ncbi:MAG: hypothetical protein EPN72_03005 [Nevskiaceae bacterium]|nr:MAG: hypothetical protein EPN63_13380 [Nevskiaceae bacterium]TBR74279.1 MAG: hypothetical protein EPN72_03005 [Nevskiaceae bacterium]
MNIKKHFQLLIYSFITWSIFYLIGLPDYYQQWPLWAEILILPLVTILYFPITHYTLKHYWNNQQHIVNSCWLAFYLTFPLFIYDYLLLAVHEKLGMQFISLYWYLTFFYFSFWIQFPCIAMKMKHETNKNGSLDSGDESGRIRSS